MTAFPSMLGSIKYLKGNSRPGRVKKTQQLIGAAAPSSYEIQIHTHYEAIPSSTKQCEPNQGRRRDPGIDLTTIWRSQLRVDGTGQELFSLAKELHTQRDVLPCHGS